jgi:hypothetical protein
MKLNSCWFKIPFTGAGPGFQVRGGALKKIAPSGGRRENFWGISCEKSRFYAKKSYFFPILGGWRGGAPRGRGGAPPLGSAPALVPIHKVSKYWLFKLLLVQCSSYVTSLSISKYNALNSSCFTNLVSESLLFNVNSVIFQLYHDENKLIFNEMMMRSALY